MEIMIAFDYEGLAFSLASNSSHAIGLLIPLFQIRQQLLSAWPVGVVKNKVKNLIIFTIIYSWNIMGTDIHIAPKGIIISGLQSYDKNPNK